jgi:hypothetical protein
MSSKGQESNLNRTRSKRERNGGQRAISRAIQRRVSDSSVVERRGWKRGSWSGDNSIRTGRRRGKGRTLVGSLLRDLPHVSWNLVHLEQRLARHRQLLNDLEQAITRPLELICRLSKQILQPDLQNRQHRLRFEQRSVVARLG